MYRRQTGHSLLHESADRTYPEVRVRSDGIFDQDRDLLSLQDLGKLTYSKG